MKSRMLRLTVLLLALLAFSHAQAEGLTEATIDRWMDSMTELQTWSDRLEAEGRGPAHEDLLDDDLFEELFQRGEAPDFSRLEDAYLRILGEHDEASDIISAHGFSDQEWASTSTRIFQALMALETRAARTEIDSEMAEAMREIENDPNIPPQYREMMQEQMRQTMGMVDQMAEGAREEDLPAVQAKQEALRDFFDAELPGEDY